jgi:hypothetical protein
MQTRSVLEILIFAILPTPKAGENKANRVGRNSAAVASTDIAFTCAAASLAILMWTPDWIWLALLVGALASAAEIARHYRDFQRIVQDWDGCRDE